MDLQTRKIKFIHEFMKIQSEEVIFQLENLLKSTNKKDVYKNDSIKTISIEEFNNRINKSEIDFEKGRYKTSSQLLKKYK